MIRMDQCVIWRTWKFVLFCLLYVAVTFCFLMTSLSDTSPGTDTVKAKFIDGRQRKLALEISVWRTDQRHRINDERRDVLSDLVNTGAGNGLEPSQKSGITLNHDRFVTWTDAKGMSCSMETYLEVNSAVCNTLIHTVNSQLESKKHKPTRSEIHQSIYQILRQRQDKSHYYHCDLTALEHNCQLVKQSYMYGKHYISDEELLVPLAFAMKIHTSENQAHRLLRYIYRPHNVYCIHVDKKASNQLFEKLKFVASCFENVIIIEDRVNVIYSTIRQVKAEMACMKAILRSKVKWKYYINLTGEEFMLKTNLEIVRILRLMNGSNNIESYPIGENVDRVATKTVLVKNWAVRTADKNSGFNKNITLKKGSAYGLFSRHFIIFIIKDNFVKEFVDWLKDTYAPEETIWATLNALPQTPGGHIGDITNVEGTFVARAVKWANSDTQMCFGKTVRHVCIYGMGDLPWLLQQRNIVANKFYENFQPLTLTCLENIMYRILLSKGAESRYNANGYQPNPAG